MRDVLRVSSVCVCVCARVRGRGTESAYGFMSIHIERECVRIYERGRESVYERWGAGVEYHFQEI